MNPKKYICRFCGRDTPNFDCSCIEKIEQIYMWNRDHNKIKMEVKQ